MFNGLKTYIVGSVSIVYAWVSVWGGTMDVGTASQITVTALTAMTIRHGIAVAVAG